MWRLLGEPFGYSIPGCLNPFDTAFQKFQSPGGRDAVRVGDLKLSEQPEAPIGKYGRMRQRYLKEHRPGLYSSLILSEKLYPHLLEIDRAARERMDAMLPRMMEAAGVTEELKARDPMRWVGLMNTLKAQAEEVIFQELIYA